MNSIIKQTPSDLLPKTNTESVSLHCSHSSSSFNVILWYKQPFNGEMQLMGYLYRTNNNTETVFENKIKLLGNGASNSNLILKSLSSDDSAIYYCAATRCCGFPALLYKNVIMNLLYITSQHRSFFMLRGYMCCEQQKLFLTGQMQKVTGDQA